MLRGKENNAGDAKVWTVDDDITLWDHLESEVPSPKLAKSPKVAALVAKLGCGADEIVARYGELVDTAPASIRLEEAAKRRRAREGLAAPAEAPRRPKRVAAPPSPRKQRRRRRGAVPPKKKKARVATPPPRRETCST